MSAQREKFLYEALEMWADAQTVAWAEVQDVIRSTATDGGPHVEVLITRDGECMIEHRITPATLSAGIQRIRISDNEFTAIPDRMIDWILRANSAEISGLLTVQDVDCIIQVGIFGTVMY